MNPPEVEVKPEAANLSEAKRHLLQQYLAGRAGSDPARVVLVSSRQREETDAPAGQFPRMRALTLEDYPRVAALESRYGLGLKSYEQWSHIWINNPAYQQLKDSWPLGWVLEDEKGEIVGAHGNIPLLYQLRDKRIVAAQGRALVVDEPYRGYSLWLLMAGFKQKTAEIYFDTTASFEAGRADRELGAMRVPVGTWDRDAFWVTNYRGFVKGWLRKRMSRRLLAVIPLLSYPLAAGLFVRNYWPRPALQTRRSGVSIEFCSAFDGKFDEFWESLRTEKRDVLLAVRDRATLEWHFAYALQQDRLWIWTLMQGSRIVGYAIFLKMVEQDTSVTWVSLVDFQALGGDPTLLQLALSAALEKCHREGIDLLQNSGLAFADSGINRCAHYQRQRPWWIYFYKTINPNLVEKVRNPSVWEPSLYDGDASIL